METALGNTSPPLQQSLRRTEFVMEEYWLLVVRMLVEGCVRNECRYLLDLVVVTVRRKKECSGN